MVTSIDVANGIAVISIDNPPVNGLSHETRDGIVRALDTALADADVTAIVLTGRPGVFSAGADIAEFGTPRAGQAPGLGQVIEALENATKPVVAAIDGTCLGGGLELALGAHYRIATAQARIGLPEVTLGLVPGAGGTQRLPRVVDVAVAADMITSGEPRTARDLAGERLLDRVVDGDVVAQASAFAAGISAVRPLPRVRDLDVPATDLSATREKLTGAAVVSPRHWQRSTSSSCRRRHRFPTALPPNGRGSPNSWRGNSRPRCDTRSSRSASRAACRVSHRTRRRGRCRRSA